MNINHHRRKLLQGILGMPALFPFLGNQQSLAKPMELKAPPVVKPPKLEKGQTIGVVAPASALPDEEGLNPFIELMEKKGYKVKLGQYVHTYYGYLAATDAQRAADLNAMFADPEVSAIFAARGGWGGARILPLLDYDTIAKNPKIMMGYSDVTSLLLAIFAQTGLVTFHGPMGLSDWNGFTRRHNRRIIMKAKAKKLRGEKEDETDLVKGRYTIAPGKATGQLVGGNLTVMSAMVGSEYVPDFEGKILFLEDIGEAVYRIDRYLMHLKLAGILDKVAGVVFSSCNNCDKPERDEKDFSLRDILEQHLIPLGIPAFFGTMVGHIEKQYTLPVGIPVEIDAEKGTIEMLETAVV